MVCKKCERHGTVILRKNDIYCEDCFLTGINHKFRACIGKSKSVPANAKVLVCLSGGAGSAALIDFIHHGISLDNTKKLRIFPVCLHLIDGEADEGEISVAEYVLHLCKKYNMDVFIAHLSDYYEEKDKLLEANCLPPTNNQYTSRFNAMLKSLSPSTRYDILLRIKRDLYVRYARLLNCDFIFSGETTKTLAINLLSNIAIGRGSQVEHDVGFTDTREEKIKILRPLKDVTNEELNYYVQIKQLRPRNKVKIPVNSLQAVIGTFINDLQDNFPATISTVCKTADKLGDHIDEEVGDKKCVVCKGSFDSNNKMTALEATNYSRAISSKKYQPQETKDIPHDHYEQISDSTIFPYVNEQFCYACSRNYAEMGNHGHRLPYNIQERLQNI